MTDQTSLQPEHWRYILFNQAVPGAVMNALVNGVMTWVLFRTSDPLSVGGDGIAPDLILGTFMLTFVTSYVISRVTYRAVANGRLPRVIWPEPPRMIRWFPPHPITGSLSSAVLAVVFIAVPALLITNAIGADPISRDAYILFKVIYFAVLGFSVTMLVTLLALAEAGNVAIPGRSGRRLREQTPP